MSKKLYSTSETAKIIGLSANYLRKLRSVGGGPRFIRISPKKCMYTLEDMDAWVAEKSMAIASVQNERKSRIAAVR